MADTTVTYLHARRRDDLPLASAFPAETRRSTQAFASPAEPTPYSVAPFPDSVLANSHRERMRAAAVAAAKRTEEQLQRDALMRHQIDEAREDGKALGQWAGYVRGWYWGLGVGFALGGSVVALCIHAGRMVATST